ncbi:MULTISPECIES: SDR family NAD(P)-dependent oxidoreductase [Streptomyces]|uniref:NAD(P)-dependent dehydrogenase (Short-subunit alcohol dehydrogenase family) n=1 Tax=Streptomyces demainii TaxID=588122 RepID=A0ABT9L573_9ACTN|nr:MULTISPECIES: SDR family NAD(P)-dependent oxidoreductase [Streptomyces]MBW8090784.1 SDR family NAD(P)-dependent oxidoreductase [Streptomyces hygroscopicus subsp. hygroscopicus]MDN3058108.1 SDR family NAD(P)-dependent oxidoreductase [Streptomyces sp. SRF1]MDP9615857.1 NAD(P)-dependent dehydrogenase (short-subunit alcohol dehydrogenase family) [Streptomyces demainii]
MPTHTPQTVLLTGASSGFGALTVRALARAGHTVYAGIRQTATRNAPAVAALRRYAAEHDIDLHDVELDVTSQESADAAVARVLADHGRLDVVVHNAGHMATGPAEAFTPDQLARLYDINVLGAQRVNRAALPHLRDRGQGLLVWIGSSSTRGGCPPFVGPYFAAKAAMDALAVAYAAEVRRFGIDTAIVVPGAFTSGTNHFSNAGAPADTERAAAYDERYGALLADLDNRLAALVPPDADAAQVADAVVRLVAAPAGTRPLRTHIDPSRDGSEVVSVVADRVRAEFFRRIGLEELLTTGSSV